MGEEPDFSHFGLPYWEPAGEVVPEDARNEKYPCLLYTSRCV